MIVRTDLPEGFVVGAATSAFQIEGSPQADGRGESIWDRYAAIPGNIEDGTTADVACDHYRRWREDVEALDWLGVDAYRFSIAWPRVQPDGIGPANPAGLDFYDRLVDELLTRGITPYVTLHHWDLPASLQDRGGWPARSTVDAYLDYADLVTAHLGDRVTDWITQNEPWCFGHLGHIEGVHAPGLRDPRAGLRAEHHLLLAHGLAISRIRANVPDARIGLSHMFVAAEAASGSPWDRDAARAVDGMFNRWYLDPLYGRGYPEDVVADLVRTGVLDGPELDFVHPGDLEAIATPTDFLGVNYYSRSIARSDRVPESENAPVTVERAPDHELTDMGWEVFPRGLHRSLVRLTRDYDHPHLVITENGAAYATSPDPNGRVPDSRRTAFLAGHLQAVSAAIRDGADVGGYFVWSLLDNYEWSFGLSKRFGLYWVDFETGRRTPKDSARWLRDFLHPNPPHPHAAEVSE